MTPDDEDELDLNEFKYKVPNFLCNFNYPLIINMFLLLIFHTFATAAVSDHEPRANGLKALSNHQTIFFFDITKQPAHQPGQTMYALFLIFG